MERIHVSVRARPLSPEDAKSSPWRISGNSISIPNQLSRFDFDRIFGEDCKTEDVYFARTRDLVAAAVRGFNGTVFAYGQTSSGKTHTMRGSNTEPGVIPLAVHDLFNIIQQEADREFLLRMSYMEIYNEEINDLLAPEHRKLQIHESIERGIFVAGLRENIVASADQVLEFMDFGESRRHIGETNMNVYSSRSHTIFRMIIESREKTGDAEADMSCDAVRVSVLNLVDLAGSERAAKTGAEGVRLKEGSHINKSLMTLGTVIKKLSEGVESQGGHVPYRDSKLTRILQPALGGNANTAIICNITLAQIHADETKSSLQFASRALRVTNCAHVNEILTDAALLKRQKKEIEDLRGKLQDFNSEHLEGEILNLRNILLKSELERERIALELEEERRAKVEKERRLQAQEKKIENLSSMVLCANREESSDAFKKVKRRDTWCSGNLSGETLKELSSEVKEQASEVKSSRKDRMMAPLLPLTELVEEVTDEDKYSRSFVEDCILPDARALLHVTSRRKFPPRKKPMESSDLVDMQAEYEKLLLKFETHRTESNMQIECLMRKLADLENVEKCTARTTTVTSDPDENRCLGELDAILVIKQLQEKIAVLEMEKSSSQQNIDRILNLATEQTLSAQDKYEKLCKDLLLAQEEATLAHQTPVSSHSRVEESDWLLSMLNEAREIKLQFEDSVHLSGSMSQFVDELFHFLPVMLNQIRELRSSALQNSLEMDSIIRTHEKLHSESMNKIHRLENEKQDLCNEVSELSHRIEELSSEVEKSANALTEVNTEHELEMSNFFPQIQMLEKEILSLSSSSLVKEKESIRKDLEKTKQKLKDTEFKLKNAIQEKIKLEGEKSLAEREVKKLHDQKVLLERDMSKWESNIGRRRDSTIDRSSNVFDQRRGRGSTAEAVMQDEYKKLEVLAFEMEATIATLDEQLRTAVEEKEEAISRAEALASELQTLSNELHMSSSESSTLKEEVFAIRTALEECKSYGEKLESSLQTLSEEKEELSMQLTEALLTMEEEKAIWTSKEKASMHVIQGMEKQQAAEVFLLSGKLSKAEQLVVDLKKQGERLSNLEIKMRHDKIEHSKEQAKLKMLLRGTQAKLDTYRVRYDELVDESEKMDSNFVQASKDLKKKLASSRIEVLDLKKQLAGVGGQLSKARNTNHAQ